MTRSEHMKWCKDRAIQEFDFYNTTKGIKEAVANGCASMASDLRKHPDTNRDATISLCIMQAMFIKDRSAFVNFINGFN